MLGMLRAPCEKLVRYVIPAIRSLLVNYMYVEMGMGQMKIAKITGMSQSAISRYVNNERGLYRALVTRIPGVRGVLEEAARMLERGEEVSMCMLCRRLKDMGVLEEALNVIGERASRIRRSARPPQHQF